METSTKDRLLQAGMSMLLEQGYNHLAIQDLLVATRVPKGSFYHHFENKEDFALQVIDLYMRHVHEGLAACLDDLTIAPLDRVRHFFESTSESYRQEGYLGCLLGGLGQELSGVSPVFRKRIEGCFQAIAGRIAGCLNEAIDQGALSPTVDAESLANLLVDCWEGAALRTRLLRDAAPLRSMLDFYFQSLAPPPGKSARKVPKRGKQSAQATSRKR